MKKVFIILMVVFVALLTSCTDQSNDTIELIEKENEIKLQLNFVDPTDDGEIGEEDRERD